jgi:trimethylamine:corrinoid methyltransferase-like protein
MKSFTLPLIKYRSKSSERMQTVDIYQQHGSRNRKLSKEQITQVNEYALELMESVGCKVDCREALDILGHAGCDIRDPGRVKIPPKLVMEAVEVAPGEIEVFNRDRDLAMVLKEDACYYGTGSDCPTTIDLSSGERRQCRKEDVARLARFCDALPNIDFIMSFGIANDAPEGGNFVHQYEAMLLNTKKPIIVTGHGENDMRAMINMAAAAVGGHDQLKSKPPVILYTDKKTFWFPRFLDRKNYELWEESGRLDLPKVLNEKAKGIFEHHQSPKLDEKVAAAIHEIVANHQPDVV